VKRRQVGYAPEADKDFDWIYDVVALGGGATIALEYVQRLRAFCQRLEHAAERGNRRDDIRTGLRVAGFEKRITVAFSVDENHVLVLQLFYGGKDWEAVLR